MFYTFVQICQSVLSPVSVYVYVYSYIIYIVCSTIYCIIYIAYRTIGIPVLYTVLYFAYYIYIVVCKGMGFTSRKVFLRVKNNVYSTWFYRIMVLVQRPTCLGQKPGIDQWMATVYNQLCCSRESGQRFHQGSH